MPSRNTAAMAWPPDPGRHDANRGRHAATPSGVRPPPNATAMPVSVRACSNAAALPSPISQKMLALSRLARPATWTAFDPSVPRKPAWLTNAPDLQRFAGSCTRKRRNAAKPFHPMGLHRVLRLALDPAANPSCGAPCPRRPAALPSSGRCGSSCAKDPAQEVFLHCHCPVSDLLTFDPGGSGCRAGVCAIAVARGVQKLTLRLTQATPCTARGW